MTENASGVTMRAVVVDRPGPPEVLQIRDLPVPQPEPGQVIRVKAFGLYRSELHFRQGVASSGSFPRVPGIEAAGIVAVAPGGEFEVGEQVVTMMGGNGPCLRRRLRRVRRGACPRLSPSAAICPGSSWGRADLTSTAPPPQAETSITNHRRKHPCSPTP